MIITGPGSRLNGADKLFSEINNSRTVKGKVTGVKGKTEDFTEDYFTAIGLVKYAIRNDIFGEDEDLGKKKKIWDRLKKFVSDLT